MKQLVLSLATGDAERETPKTPLSGLLGRPDGAHAGYASAEAPGRQKGPTTPGANTSAASRTT
jgi:hypothetical protein